MIERRAIAVRGTVQGVGFRPFVFGLASRLRLGGYVSNRSGQVEIEVEGSCAKLDAFLSELKLRPPPLAHIDALTWELKAPTGDRTFHIRQSMVDPAAQVVIPPDMATCDDCLAELFDAGDRRYRYPFLNCTNCGPRLTIIIGAPYDRERTTMARFAMCDACRAEYEDPANRRFHAQPIACPICGPRLSAFDGTGKPIAVDDPLRWFIEALRAQRIGAMKGLGGYHLVCDALSEAAVGELRRRKHRDEKPFAVMVRDASAAEALCEVSAAERELLESPRRPIVLLRKRSTNPVVDLVAPTNPFLGVMLPYTPLHHLLMAESAGALVMSSGNASDDPIVTGEPECFERLAGIADLFLTNDRPIHIRCDDSVSRIIGSVTAPIRRSRGYAPEPIQLPIACRAPILAVGGQLKGTFALGIERNAIVSQHLGDLDHLEAYRAFERDIALYERLFATRPNYIAHDLHPDYASTRYARKRAEMEGIQLIAVQHHHAHMASCMAEHGVSEPVIGVSFDGTGFGTDGAVWGGEFLIGDLKSFKRAAHLRYVPMPGADRAIKEPWRMAVSHLVDAELGLSTLRNRIDSSAIRTVEQMLAKGFNSPLTSSVGRLFDAVASLLGLNDRVSFEGQAAMQLEWLATASTDSDGYPFDLVENESSDGSTFIELDTRNLLRAIVHDVEFSKARAMIAKRFHTTLAKMIVETCVKLRELSRLNIVTLSGGVFMNATLRQQTESYLKDYGFYPLNQRRVPVNDGGISLGQLAIAACQIGVGQCV